MNAIAPRAERVDAQRNRRKVLETADRLFAEGGTAVALGEIAAAAGVGAGTVYRHFPTKDALLATVLDHRMHQLGAFGEEALEAGDPEAAFFSYLRHIAGQALDNRAICEALSGRGDWHEPSKAVGQCVIDNPLGTLLLRAQEAGAVRRDLSVRDVRALLAGFTSMAASADSPEQARRLSQFLYDGLRTGAERNLEIRNETAATPEIRNETKRNCPVCGGAVPVSATGRPAKFCSSACRQKAFREQRKTAAPPPAAVTDPAKSIPAEPAERAAAPVSD